MSSVNFGSSTLSTLTKSGLSSPSSAALSVMENNHWPIYVTGSNQIVFHLQAPFQWFLGLLVPWMSQVFDAQYVLNNGGFGTPGNYNTAFNQHPIPGTGPYVVTQVSENNLVTFAQNPTYWGDSLTPAQIAAQPMFDPGHVKNVVINYKPDDVTRYTDLSTGTAQVAMIMAQDWNLVNANPNEYSYVATSGARSPGQLRRPEYAELSYQYHRCETRNRPPYQLQPDNPEGLARTRVAIRRSGGSALREFLRPGWCATILLT